LAFSFTQDDIGEAMLNRAEAGVKVQGVFETTGSETDFSYYPIMLSEGLQVRQDGNPRVMHHKVIIIDRDTVVFGSYNFSQNANDSNDENLLIVYDPTFAQAFVREFEKVWSEAKPN
jgi:phosphatidylserine/phosphatidylglycerophosphate/cardiolipin synthase-like enzyme